MNRSCNRDRGRQGFTLVELLVVIGIIAVLIGILLPTLARARRAAYTVQCSSNMKQIATSLLMYIHANKGKHPPTAIHPTGVANLYPNGWWWANELVKQNYIKAPNAKISITATEFHGDSVFRCPEGVPPELSFSSSPQYPTDAFNNSWRRYSNDHSDPANPFSIPSWYQLNSSNLGNGNRMPSGGSATPFVFFNNNQASSLRDPSRTRTISMVRKSAEMVMLVEAAEANFTYAPSNTYPDNKAQRLGARHGRKTATGRDAYTNFAFFDGHVAMYATQPISKAGFGAFTRDHVFFLRKQQ